jgi:hypothetical protein
MSRRSRKWNLERIRSVGVYLNYACGIPDYRIFGAFAWASTAHFDVTARGPANASTATTPAMVRGLLAERLQSRRGPVDVLVVEHVRAPTPN